MSACEWRTSPARNSPCVGRRRPRARDGAAATGRAATACSSLSDSAAADRHVVDLVDRLGGVGHGAASRLACTTLCDVAEVARGLAVAVDAHRLAAQHRGDPARDHRGIGAVRILARAEHVEVAQADRSHAVAAAEHVGVQLVDVLGHRIRRQRPADQVLDLRQAGMVAVGRARRGVDEARDLASRAATSMLRKPVALAACVRERIGDRARHRAERRLVQHEVDALAGVRGRRPSRRCRLR